MGNGNSSVVSVSIHLDETDKLYLTGDIVSGSVGLNITRGKLEADQIYIQLKGNIGYITLRDGSSESAEYHNITIYSSAVTCAQSEFEQEVLVFTQGQYFWPFQFQLPDHLPPTMYGPEVCPNVRYYLQVIVHKSGYKPYTKEIKYLKIYPRVNLLQNPQCLETTTADNQNRKNIMLKATLNKSGYVPGELIGFTLEIQNPQKLLIKHINISMLKFNQIKEHKQRYTMFQVTLPKILNLKDQQIRGTFSMIIPPIPIPPSYKFHGGVRKRVFVDIRETAVVWILYTLKFTVEVEGMFTNFDVDIPITIGTEPNPDPNQQQILNPMIVSYSSNPEQSMFTDHDLPPDYDTAVRNLR